MLWKISLVVFSTCALVPACTRCRLEPLEPDPDLSLRGLQKFGGSSRYCLSIGLDRGALQQHGHGWCAGCPRRCATHVTWRRTLTACCIRVELSRLYLIAVRNAVASVSRLCDCRWKSDGLGKWSALNESLPGRIFISYRRQETAWPARQLYDVLVEHFPAEQVFKDVDNIEPGEEFVERITAAVESCDVLLALIGPQWLTITNEKGQRRLDNPEDYVRLEIETALTRKIRVIPILVDEARMPGADELPATLAPLVRRNAVEINPVTFDTKRLISTVRGRWQS